MRGARRVHLPPRHGRAGVLRIGGCPLMFPPYSALDLVVAAGERIPGLQRLVAVLPEAARRVLPARFYVGDSASAEVDQPRKLLLAEATCLAACGELATKRTPRPCHVLRVSHAPPPTGYRPNKSSVTYADMVPHAMTWSALSLARSHASMRAHRTWCRLH